jgi:hypothetical protein
MATSKRIKRQRNDLLFVISRNIVNETKDRLSTSKRYQPNKQNIKILTLENRNISVNMRIKALVAV